MRILLANLKHFYQRRGLWLSYFYYGLLISLGVLMTQLPGEAAVFTCLIAVAVVGGWTVAATQVEIVSKPFSFCLPGHRENVRRLVFLVGLPISARAGWALAASQSPVDMNPGPFALVLSLGLCFTLTVYLLSTGLAFVFRNTPAASGFLGFAVLGVFMLQGLRPKSLLIILDHPFLVIPLGALAAVVAWWWLGRPYWVRACCAKPVGGLLFAWDQRSWLQKQRQDMVSTGALRPPPWLDRSFQHLMRTGGHPGLAKYIWGAIYIMLLPVTARRTRGALVVVALFALVLLAGYRPFIAPFLLTLFPLLMALDLDKWQLSIFWEMPIAGGRRERFYATLVLVGVLAAFSILSFALTVITLNWLMPLLPEMRIGDLTPVFHKVSLRPLMLPMMAFPIVGLAAIWLYRRQAGRGLSAAVLIIIVLLDSYDMLLSETPLRIALFVTTLSWLVCALGIRRIAMHSDLVRR